MMGGHSIMRCLRCGVRIDRGTKDVHDCRTFTRVIRIGIWRAGKIPIVWSSKATYAVSVADQRYMWVLRRAGIEGGGQMSHKCGAKTCYRKGLRADGLGRKHCITCQRSKQRARHNLRRMRKEARGESQAGEISTRQAR